MSAKRLRDRRWSPLAAAMAPASAPVGLEEFRPTLGYRGQQLVLDYGVVMATAVLIAVGALGSPYFLDIDNLLNIGDFSATTGIVAVGFTIALLAGLVDLSLAAYFSLAAIGYVQIVETYHQPVIVGVLVAFGLALMVALLNGVISINWGVDPMIATLATGSAGVSLAALWAHGKLVFMTDEHSGPLIDLVYARVLGIPSPLILTVFVFVFAWVLLKRTRFGANLYSVGGNANAAVRAGIPATRYYRYAFLLNAFFGALAGIVSSGRIMAGDFHANAFGPAFTAVLVGGVSFTGGLARIELIIVGVVFISVFNNELALLEIDAFDTYLAQTVVLLLAVAGSSYAAKRRAQRG